MGEKYTAVCKSQYPKNLELFYYETYMAYY